MAKKMPRRAEKSVMELFAEWEAGQNNFGNLPEKKLKAESARLASIADQMWDAPLSTPGELAAIIWAQTCGCALEIHGDYEKELLRPLIDAELARATA